MTKHDVFVLIEKENNKGYYVGLYEQGDKKGFIFIPAVIKEKGKAAIQIDKITACQIVQNLVPHGYSAVVGHTSEVINWLGNIARVQGVHKGTKKLTVTGKVGGIIASSVEIDVRIYEMQYISNNRVMTLNRNTRRLEIHYNVKNNKIQATGGIIHQCTIEPGCFNGFVLMNNLVFNNKVVGKRVKFNSLVFDIDMDNWLLLNKMEKCNKVQEKIRNCKMVEVNGTLLTASELKHGESIVGVVKGV